jgi:hypothetical protein
VRDYHARVEAATGGEPRSKAASKIGVARNADFKSVRLRYILSGLVFGAVYEVFRDLTAKDEIVVASDGVAEGFNCRAFLVFKRRQWK